MKKLFHPQAHNIHHTFRYVVIGKCIIPNYNGCKLLTFFQIIEEPLSTRVSECSKASKEIMAVKKVSSNELHTINLKIVSVRQSKKAASHWMRMNPNSIHGFAP